jgi:phytoene dehydrogenase-like protein
MEGSVNPEVAIIGGGLSGLTTAALIARAGKIVRLFEQSSSEIGGRARTSVLGGFYFNQGAHALYLSGIGAAVLQELGVKYTGGLAATSGFAIKQGKKYRLPSNRSSVLTTRILGISSKLEYAKFFDSLGKIDFSKLEKVTVQEWLDSNIKHEDVADMIKTLLRLNTYGNDPDVQSAGSAFHQLHVAVEGGTMYLDGGWQTLVDGLVTVAKNAGARIVMGKKVIKVEKNNSGWLVTLSDRTQVSVKVLVIAAGPKDAYSVFHDNERPEVVSKVTKEAKPVRMACLDIALSRLPNKDVLFALGVDSPVYFSVHSAYAKLGPENGGALIHVAKYLGTSIEPKPREDQEELEELLDFLQPGWREVLIRKRPLPNMVISNALVTAINGGLSGRADPGISENLYIVGDWIGKEGLLSNASFASAKRAAQLILSQPR